MRTAIRARRPSRCWCLRIRAPTVGPWIAGRTTASRATVRKARRVWLTIKLEGGCCKRARPVTTLLKGYEMRNSNGKRKWLGLLIVCVALGAGAVLLPLLSSAKAQPAATISVRVVNNSAWEIRHLYLSPADQD